MPTAVSRALLQVLYLEQHGSPRTPNALRELLGLIDVRAGGEAAAPRRKTLDIHGAAHLADDPSARAIKISCAGDVVVEPAITGTLHNYSTTLWDDASIALFALSGDTTITGFDAFSCRRWEKLVVNTGGGSLTITHQSTQSQHDNRVHCSTAANVVLAAGQAAWLVRDFTGARWRLKAIPLVSALVIDAMIAAGGSAPNFAGSTSHRLYSAYTGPLIRVRHSVTTTQTDIGYGSDNRLDIAALNAAGVLGGAGDLTIVTLYDQSGNGRDVTNATAAQQPKIYDSSTGVVLQGSLPWATFTTASATRLARGDSAGITGAEAVACCHFTRSTSTSGIWIDVGAIGTPDFRAGHTTSLPSNVSNGNGQRLFTLTDTLADTGLYVHQLAAGALLGVSTLRKNGVALAQSSVSSVGPINITATAFVIGSNPSGNNAVGGGGCFWLADDAEITGGALTALETFGATLSTLS